MALDIMRFIPLISLPFVYWELGNRQIFGNNLATVKNISDQETSGHYLTQSIDTVLSDGIVAPNFAPFVCYLFILLMVPLWGISRCFFSAKKEDMFRADCEDLEPFSAAMSYESRMQLLNNEHYFRKKYGVATMTEE